MLPTLGLFLVALIILPRSKPSSFLTASSSDSEGLSDSLSEELSELELAPGFEVGWGGMQSIIYVSSTLGAMSVEESPELLMYITLELKVKYRLNRYVQPIWFTSILSWCC